MLTPKTELSIEMQLLTKWLSARNLLTFHIPVLQNAAVDDNEFVTNLDEDRPCDESFETAETVDPNVQNGFPSQNRKLEDMLSSAPLSKATPASFSDTVGPCRGQVNTQLK